MSTNKLFSIAGTSVLKGTVTFRFATGKIEDRVWVLKHNEHTKVALCNLPVPMLKQDAIAFLKQENWQGADVAVLPNSKKATVADFVAAKVKTDEELKAEAAEAKRIARNEAKRAARAAAKAAKVVVEDEAFLEEVPSNDELPDFNMDELAA